MRHSLIHNTETTRKFKAMNHVTAKVICRKELLNKNGLAPLALKAHVNGEKIVVSLSVMVNPKDWLADKQQIKATAPNAIQINQIVSEALSRTLSVIANSNMGNIKLSKYVFQNLYKQSSLDGDFNKYALDKIEKRLGSKIDYTTYKTQKAVLNKLHNFKSNIQFSDLTPQLLEQFEKHLKTKLRNNTNTIHNAFRIIKTYTRCALEDGYIFSNPFLRFKMKRAETHRTYLTKEEVATLLKLYNSATLPPLQQTSLLFFLVSCFTSLRISDVTAITPAMIQSNHLILTPHKTRSRNKQVKIPITHAAAKLLPQALSSINNLVTEQRINKHLKIIAKTANIKKTLTFHVSRHTFATMFLDLGGKVETLKEIMAHSDIETTMIYTHITDNRKEAEMQNFNKYFSL